MHAALWTALILCCLPAAFAAPQEPLQKLENCTLVPQPWADGDSFRIKTAAGEEHTLRLYGADCIEWHINDDTDARRLRAQRQYFGITEAAPNPAQAIALAKDFGKQAAEKTAALLASPFTVHTRFRDALGDGQHKRIYGFVTCADGSDLAATLVKSGLARAFGVYSTTPDGRTLKDVSAMLADLELQAAKRGAGIWAKTNWEKLPAERQAQRRDAEQVELALEKQPAPENFKLNPNTAARDDLMKLPGIGEEMANRIIENRPYETAEDLLEVEGIGSKKLDAIRPHLDFKKP
jgi:competence protein ComEA